MFGFILRRPPLLASVMIPGSSAALPDRHGLAIVAIMKNEAAYISDWLKFHSLGGVRHFIIYDDGSTDGSAEIVKSTPGISSTVIPWRFNVTVSKPPVSLSKQVLAYCHAIENFGQAYRWMAFLDVDEFLFPKHDDRITDVLDKLGDFSNISVSWTMFGPCGHDESPEISVPFAYTMRAAERSGALLNFKCIVDPEEVTEVRVHRFQTRSMKNDSANDAGVICNNKRRGAEAFVASSILQLNHYYTKSRSELSVKLLKGAVSGSPQDRRNAKVMEKLTLIEQTEVLDCSAIEFLARHGVAPTKHLPDVAEDRLSPADAKQIGQIDEIRSKKVNG